MLSYTDRLNLANQELTELENELSQYRIFKNDRSFVRTGRYKREAAAVGAGIRFVEEFFDSLY